ncbi:MAG: BRO family protein [Sedimentibacter sp.]|uniref:BRO-N domain-containing protein n=1 Tax=Sedimentibacter sp. TaxID=1960295 RepID=UPI002980DDE9|nr:BRO family protein [Sedimentibacter sp.]MDW5298853.1 BRO family protein [Sedimentibacter sp.]
MDNLEIIKSENFGEIELDFYQNNDNELFMTREQIGSALEYKNPNDAIRLLHKRNKERLDKFSVSFKLNGTDGKLYNTTLYSYKGIYEICRLSRQPKADKFMDWVWDVVEEIRTKGYYGLTNLQEEIKQIEINPENLNKAYEQSAFIANIMDEAGVSGKTKLQAVKNIYQAMGINLFEKTNETKSKVDYEIDELINEIASEMSEYQCKLKILEISKDTEISDKIKYGSIYVYVQALNLIHKKYMNKFLLE